MIVPDDITTPEQVAPPTSRQKFFRLHTVQYSTVLTAALAKWLRRRTNASRGRRFEGVKILLFFTIFALTTS